MKSKPVARKPSAKKTPLEDDIWSKMPLPPPRPARPLPTTKEDWLAEMQAAWMDAGAAKPFGPLVGIKITDTLLFHVAPMVALKFRGKQMTGKQADKVCEAAMATYVANFGPEATKKNRKKYAPIAFALCYVMAHVVMRFIDEEQAQEIMEIVEDAVFSVRPERVAGKRRKKSAN